MNGITARRSHFGHHERMNGGTRLRRFDSLAFAAWVCAWLLCFGFAFDSVVSGVGRPPLVIARGGPGEYPRVVGFNNRDASLARAVREGDLVIALDGFDMRGKGSLELYLPFARHRGPDRVMQVTVSRAGEQSTSALRVPTYTPYWPRLPASLVFACCALLLRRRSRNPAVSAIVHAFMATATFLACAFNGDEPVATFSIVAHLGSVALVGPLTLRAALLFPNGVTPRWRGARALPWPFLVLGPLGGSRFYELLLPRSIGVPANAVAEASFLILLLAIGTANYRRADAVGRRQLKWISLALYLAVAFPLAAVALAAHDARYVSTLVISMASLALIPLAMLIAVWRDNLFDIDRLIGATALHTLLLAALCAFAWLEGLLTDGMGLAPHIARTLLVAGACGVLAPLYLLLKPRVERIFPSEQQRLASGVLSVLAELPTASAAHDLLRSAADLLYAKIGVESCAVYAGGAEGFLPIRCCGAATATVLPRTSALMATLTNTDVARAEDLLHAKDAAALPELERAALAALGMPLLLPLRGAGRLTALLCVGPRRSGIEYGAADLHWFELLRDRIAIELDRRDERDAAARSHALARRLAAYVPAAIAREIESGQPLRQGSCEVSVLFVDIRGYSGYCEPRSGEAIHAAVNAHTLWVSEVLVRHGGAVVDFSGDGLLAIFGAPRDLANKESCALAAALEIATASFGARAGERLAVGIGIATGETYLGHIQAFDRRIWSAVGNTTNLAARLQAKARPLDAAIVIDATTFARARPEPQLFKRFPAQSIRGRERLEDLYAVPLRSLSPDPEPAAPALAEAQRRVLARVEGEHSAM